MFFRANKSGPNAEHQECSGARAGFEIHTDAQIPADFFVSHSVSRRIRTIFIPGMNEDLPVKYPSRIYSLTADELGIFPPKSMEAGPTFFRLSALKAIHSYRAPLYGALEFEGDTSAQFFYRPVHRAFVDSFLRSARFHWLSSRARSGKVVPQPVPWNELNKIQEHLLNSELDPEEEVLNLSVRSVIRRKPRFSLGRQQKGAAACLVLTDRRLLVITSDETSQGLPSFVSIHSVRSEGVSACLQIPTSVFEITSSSKRRGGLAKCGPLRFPSITSQDTFVHCPSYGPRMTGRLCLAFRDRPERSDQRMRQGWLDPVDLRRLR